jgi:hypothetical protein
MKNKKTKCLSIFLLIALLIIPFTACSKDSSDTSSDASSSAPVSLSVEYKDEDTNSSWDAASATKISLNGSSVQ